MLFDVVVYLFIIRFDMFIIKFEFFIISWYKFFGFFIGVGCLVVKKEVLFRFVRFWFFGGII